MIYFRHYLFGQKFSARTDHASLRWLTKFKNPEGQVARWLEVISTFSMAIEHRSGRLHGNADGLSRKPCDDAERNSIGESSLNNTKQKNPSCMQVGSGSSENQSDKTIDLTALQEEEDELSVVRSWVEQSVKPNFNAISSEGYAMKSLWSQFPCLELHNGLLVRRVEDTDNNTVTYQALVPKKARRSVLNLGVSKTGSRVRQKFYWPGYKQMLEVMWLAVKYAAKERDQFQINELLCKL